MSRYVNADMTDSKILDLVQKETSDADTFITVRRILNKLPTEDVHEIIMCKYCRYGRSLIPNDIIECSLNHEHHTQNWFCADGKYSSNKIEGNL